MSYTAASAAAAVAALHSCSPCLQAQLEARDSDIARLRHDMAAEVSEAAQQVQHLLAAQARVSALEAELVEASQVSEVKQSEVGARMAGALATPGLLAEKWGTMGVRGWRVREGAAVRGGG